MTTLPANSLSPPRSRLILLQSLTLVWMLIECAVALVSAARSHSPALLAFGSDSLIELLSAALVVLALAPRFQLNRRPIDRAAAILLFLLAAVVGLTSILAFARGLRPEASPCGIAITVAALVVMPLLAWQKRKLAERLRPDVRLLDATLLAPAANALAADAVQSATCAYLALITLVGLALNAVFHIAWADSLAALAAIPILIIEGRRTLRGHGCGCC
jgi:divalent metal cation (Fe/Co/Zn/Cd) transporter